MDAFTSFIKRKRTFRFRFFVWNRRPTHLSGRAGRREKRKKSEWYWSSSRFKGAYIANMEPVFRPMVKKRAIPIGSLTKCPESKVGRMSPEKSGKEKRRVFELVKKVYNCNYEFTFGRDF